MEQQHSIYTTKAGDVWDLIAFVVYGSEEYVKELFKANPELSIIAIFPSNTAIKCPDIEKKAGDLPPWAL